MMAHSELYWVNTFERGHRLFLIDINRLNDLRTLLKTAEERLAQLKNKTDINEQEILEEKAIVIAVQREILRIERRLSTPK